MYKNTSVTKLNLDDILIFNVTILIIKTTQLKLRVLSVLFQTTYSELDP
jgi:hypothetical protein